MTATSPRQFRIKGMDCAEEVAILKRSVGPVVGGEDNLTFDILNAKMTVAECDEERSDEVVAAVARTGMHAEPWSREADAAKQDGLWSRHGRTLTTAVSGIFLSLGFLWSVYTGGGFLAGFRHDLPAASKGFYLAAAVAAGWFVLPRAWFALRRLSPDMNLLMTVAVMGAIGIGEWFEAGAVYFLFSVSLLLESWSVGRARRAVEALLDLTPTVVHVIDADGAIRDASPEQTLLERSFARPASASSRRHAGRRQRGESGPITGRATRTEGTRRRSLRWNSQRRRNARHRPLRSPPMRRRWLASSAWSPRRKAGGRQRSVGWNASRESIRPRF